MSQSGGANNSAGVKPGMDYAHNIVEKMIHASVKGNHNMAKILATIGDKKISTASMNKLMLDYREPVLEIMNENVLNEDDFNEYSQPDTLRMNP